MGRLVRYSWPGNIRELQNIIERAFVLSRGSVLSLDGDLLPIGAMAARAQSPAGPAGFSTPSREASAGSPSPAADGPTALNEVEKQHILAVLAQTSWIIEGPGGAAKLLHLHPNTLRSRLKKLGIRRPTHEIS
jgi:formate hydrogenlyase transcriptional activator